MKLPTLDLQQCRARQQRLLDAAARWDTDLLILTRPESILWLTGFLVRNPLTALATLKANGRVTLVLPERNIATPAAADEMIGYEATWHSTMRDEQQAASVAALQSTFAHRPRRLGCEFSTFHSYLADTFDAERIDIDSTMYALRRHKDTDELSLMSWANEANRAMYECARRIVEPGTNELELYNELQAVAVRQVGEALTYFGQDFQSGSRGGAARDREARAGELYILDLGVGYRGYFSDNARTLSVGGNPSDAQQRAWQAVSDVFSLVQSRVRPGVSCRQLFEDVQQQLDALQPWRFDHHLGHGVGLAPHEGPHLNPNWDDVFAVGDFFTVEPGLYHDDLQLGLRLEQNYLVTENGVELLTDWPLELV